MGKWLIGIVLQAGVILISGLLLAYLGFLSPVFRRSSERLAPDRWVGIFRNVRGSSVRCCVLPPDSKIFSASVRKPRSRTCIGTISLRQTGVSAFPRRPTSSRRSGMSPTAASARFHAVMPNLGFLVSYIDLPAEILKSTECRLEYGTGPAAAGHEVGTASQRNDPSERLSGGPLQTAQRAGRLFCGGHPASGQRAAYQLAVQYTSEASMPTCDQFFNSFQVLDGP